MAGDALRDSLAAAARDLNAASSLDETLATIARAAQTSVPGADHVGVTMWHPDGRLETRAATSDRAREFDDLQLELGDGPCLAAIEADTVVYVPDVHTDTRWPDFLLEAGRRGLRSQIGIRLYGDSATRAGLNIYSEQRLEQDSVRAASLFAAQAAVATAKAMVIDQLLEGMQSRQRIGVAVGLLMHKYEMSEERAFAYLTRASSHANIKLRDVAAGIVDDFVARVDS